MTLLPQNRVLTALEQGGLAHGTWVQSRSPEACATAAACGFDFVVVDMQHGTLALPDVAAMVAAVRAGGATAVVRLPDASPILVGHLLDAGAQGLLVPDVKCAADVAAVLDATAYPPKGSRGACPTTVASHHGAVGWPEYRRWADSEIVVWALIEHPNAVADVEAIAATGVHALVPGPFDLSLALGTDGDLGHPSVAEAVSRIHAAAAMAGIETMSVLFDRLDGVADAAEAARRAGSRIITATSDRWLLSQGWHAALAGLRRPADEPVRRGSPQEA